MDQVQAQMPAEQKLKGRNHKSNTVFSAASFFPRLKDSVTGVSKLQLLAVET